MLKLVFKIGMLISIFLALSISAFANTGSVHIKNATVLTITQGDLENTDVLIIDGKITQIGQNLQTPRGVDILDAEGMYVMPGIIDSHSHLAITRGVNEWMNPVSAEVTMKDVLNPNDVGIYRALAGGVTSAQIKHGSANVIGGRSATVKFRFGESAADFIFEGAPQLIKFALGENPTRVHGQGRGIQPRTRMGVEQVVRETFDAALDYRARRNAYLEAKELHDRRPRRNPAPQPVPKNLRLEVVADILEGKVLVQSHCYRADEILMLMRVFNDYGVENYTFHHITEGYKVIPELVANNAAASSFMDWWAFKFEAYFATSYSPAMMFQQGVLTSLHSDSPALIRHMNHEAAKAVKYGGLTKNEALKLITINPAIQMGISDRVGSLEVGKDGDISIWSAHPLSIYAVNQYTFVDGVQRFNINEDPDDMRLQVDPEFDFTYRGNITGREHDACLENLFYLFDSTGQIHSHSHSHSHSH